jgi:hypothetical protein
MRKLIGLILLILSMLTSCYTYVEYNYRGYDIIEYNDTIRLEPIHFHIVRDSLNYCIWVDEFKIPFNKVYVKEYWDVKEKRRVLRK